jgi:hypothetical protein
LLYSDWFGCFTYNRNPDSTQNETIAKGSVLAPPMVPIRSYLVQRILKEGCAGDISRVRRYANEMICNHTAQRPCYMYTYTYTPPHPKSLSPRLPRHSFTFTVTRLSILIQTSKLTNYAFPAPHPPLPNNHLPRLVVLNRNTHQHQHQLAPLHRDLKTNNMDTNLVTPFLPRFLILPIPILLVILISIPGRNHHH